LAVALDAEVATYLAAHAREIDERGRRLVVRNGHAVPRQVLTTAGAVEVRAPRVDDKRVDEVSPNSRSNRRLISSYQLHGVGHPARPAPRTRRHHRRRTTLAAARQSATARRRHSPLACERDGHQLQ
jgi:hypothetical protein